MLIPGKSHSQSANPGTRSRLNLDQVPTRFGALAKSRPHLTHDYWNLLLSFGEWWLIFAGDNIVSICGRAELTSACTHLHNQRQPADDSEQTCPGPCKPYIDTLSLPLNVGLKVRSQQMHCSVSHCTTQCNAFSVNKLLRRHACCGKNDATCYAAPHGIATQRIRYDTPSLYLVWKNLKGTLRQVMAWSGTAWKMTANFDFPHNAACCVNTLTDISVSSFGGTTWPAQHLNSRPS